MNDDIKKVIDKITDPQMKDMCDAIERLTEFYNESMSTDMDLVEIERILHNEVFPAFTRARPAQVMSAFLAIHEWFNEPQFRELVLMEFVDFLIQNNLIKEYVPMEQPAGEPATDFNLFDRLKKWM